MNFSLDRQPDNRLLLAWGYLLFALAGLILLWVYNCRAMLSSTDSLSLQNILAADCSHPFDTFIRIDFFIITVPALVWMLMEGRRLKMPYWWLYLALAFTITFAITCPLFFLLKNHA
ncbi:DUF2834 domain-containing protein [Spirosoma sp. BT702]|uniref:DUF2834 domain-containing protein n=1 Tax=Spirosoma profusum TaxID=2771354 RepID=A0A926XWM3_9BACT|nr:DUF2834 domain-containing protein [Spirosoma profusum]MBD2701311.1 DUF2834 domain-containing protein [Spirosoma profusum]